ncbi:extra-large guanine nucleotide-binding protein 1 isoform X2 [Musa acuminata AAA Group]|uniref:extra-large guanine nucleotide-binding protein 1 isoform X2 n=1 Tax=Musa acuminata AAA Group TaxID=214697 RepID=UPI0031DB6E42
MNRLLTVVAEAADYSFAVEYNGPPLPYEIPRAVPIDVNRIPLAAVAPPSAVLSDLPVVHPLPSPFKKPPPPPLPAPTLIPPLPAASPTSVIENHDDMDGPDADVSGALGSSGFPDISTELSEVVESSGAVGFSDDLGYDATSSNEMVPNRLSTESALSSELSFRSSASGDEDEDEAVATHAKKALLVTFQESGQSGDSMSPAIGLTPRTRSEELEMPIKKGACYRCLKGSRFTEKESCLACDARYCSGCVLRVMGSMPEGRKCVSCIGYPILESNRERLGKSSRVLKRLLSSREVHLVMKAEKDCETNQLRPEDICVNGKKLTLEEMVLLKSCSCPPKLKPGLYWYDKVSGYWGKEGHKPDRIITPHLNVGGTLMPNASNGNTGILINGREITKIELQMLKWAGVHCAGSPHFWLNADGTYLEEGQKNIKGQIWGKPIMKLLCPVLALPFPSKVANPSGEEVNKLFNRAVSECFDVKALQKILLVGHHGSGTGTIFKQAKFLYRSVPFTEDERQDIKLMIQTSIYNYLLILLEGREWFEEESLNEQRENQQLDSSGDDISDKQKKATEFSLSPQLKAFSDCLLKVVASGKLEDFFPNAPLVEELWNDSAIQATYKRLNELQSLPSIASYFLKQVVDISRIEYVPSDIHILYADGITSSDGLACTEFHFPPLACAGSSIDDDDQQETMFRYQLIRVHSKGLGENCKWLDMFDDVQIVVFCVAITDYDEYYEDSNGVVMNKMMESRRLFECIASHPTFEQKDFLLILSKFDLLEQKIDMSPLTSCEWFDDYSPVVSRHPQSKTSRGVPIGATKAQQAFQYIAVKFKRLFFSMTRRKLYVVQANGLDSDSVDAALRYSREIIKWEEDRFVGGTIESMYSTEPSSFSQ